MLAEAREKERRDIQAMIEDGRKEGRNEGRNEGRKEGRNEGRNEILELMEKGYTPEQIRAKLNAL
jgi:flagellar biosynthesis/type III secretory pathway protein FliH